MSFHLHIHLHLPHLVLPRFWNNFFFFFFFFVKRKIEAKEKIERKLQFEATFGSEKIISFILSLLRVAHSWGREENGRNQKNGGKKDSGKGRWDVESRCDHVFFLLYLIFSFFSFFRSMIATLLCEVPSHTRVVAHLFATFSNSRDKSSIFTKSYKKWMSLQDWEEKKEKKKGKRKKEKGATPVSAQMPSSGRSQYFPFESISVGKISWTRHFKASPTRFWDWALVKELTGTKISKSGCNFLTMTPSEFFVTWSEESCKALEISHQIRNFFFSSRDDLKLTRHYALFFSKI